MKPLLLLTLLSFFVLKTKSQNCPALNPANDATGIALDLIISEINPGDYIELYNTTNLDIALSSLQHQFCSPFNYAALSVLGPNTIVPAKGYATVPWPSNFSDVDAGGEVILYKNSSFHISANIIDYVCWGVIPHASRKIQAEAVGKWMGGCSGALTNGAIHRVAGSMGISTISYDVVSAPSPLNCAPDPCDGINCDDANPCTRDTCIIGECFSFQLHCNDTNFCTRDFCDTSTGCYHEAVVCTLFANACTTGVCDPSFGCLYNPISCDDGNLCTIDGCDTLSGCTVIPKLCDDGDSCTIDACILLTGGCTITPVVCDDGDPCTTDGCNPLSGCTATPVACDDGDTCTADACDNGVCVSTPICLVAVSGTIRTEIDSPVANVIMNLSGTSSSSDTTGGEGVFAFEVPPDSNYVITPVKNNDLMPNNGVTTFDILLMQRHILQISPLGSPYKIIAGDVNGSGGVTTFDILLTRALILGNTISFPGGRLWEFVPDDYVFPNPQNPSSYPNSRTYEKIDVPLINQNFIGIKLGDVNGSWDPANP